MDQELSGDAGNHRLSRVLFTQRGLNEFDMNDGNGFSETSNNLCVCYLQFVRVRWEGSIISYAFPMSL